MSDTRSPIERMIDEACGVPKDWKPKPHDIIILVCPKCGKRGSTDRMHDDPPDLKSLTVECPDCV